MAYFARKLRYGACDGEGSAFYFALIEFARKKGGQPTGFALYRRFINCRDKTSKTEMIRLTAETTEEAIRRFWPSDTKGAGKEFPGHKSKQWKKTTLWLGSVAAGGWYERFGYKYDHDGIRPGWWVKVGTPAPRARRQKRKKPLQVGNISHILLAHQARLGPLAEERSRLMQKLLAFETIDEDDKGSYISDDDVEEHDLISAEMQKIEDEIDSVYEDIARTKAEMQYMIRKIFPKPMGLTPKRILRYERERKQCLGI